MAKRFTETEKWKDPWFCGLNEKQKLFWFYLLDTCDHAGIWQVNWPLVDFYIKGYKHDSYKFEGRILYISENKWFIKKFIDFQYKGKLNPDNSAHKSVIDRLEKEGAWQGLASPLAGSKDKDMDKDKVKDMEGIVKGNQKELYLSAVYLTKEEHAKLITRFGDEGVKQRIYDLNNGIMSKGYKYKSHYHTILSWERRHERLTK
jgi:hypothetical protein